MLLKCRHTHSRNMIDIWSVYRNNRVFPLFFRVRSYPRETAGAFPRVVDTGFGVGFLAA